MQLAGFGITIAQDRQGLENMTKKTKNFNFEEALANLEGLVEAMEEGELTLEESLKAFEQGIKLTRECQQALDQAEHRRSESAVNHLSMVRTTL